MTPPADDSDERPRRAGDRAVSATVGFVLVLGFVLVAFSVYQGIVVPEQNRHVEFDHSRAVQSQFVDLRSAVGSAATGEEGSVAVDPGADYPMRTIANNLGRSVGEVRTEPADSGVRIANVTAIDDESADYVGDGTTTLSFETASVRYEPNYLWYSNAPTTVYEHSVVYNRFDDGSTVAVSDQAIVDGRRITLVAVNGSLSKAQSDTVSVDVEALSASSERFSVTNTSGGRLNLTVPTDQPRSAWLDLLADEMNASPNDGRYVEAVKDTGPGQVSILLEPGVTYDLRLAKVGVGSQTAGEDPHYVTDVSGDETSIAEGGSRKLVVEVRDRFNNPASDVTVESRIDASAGSGDTVTPASVTTGADGRAAFTYDAPDDVDGTQDAEVTAYFNSTALDREKVTFGVSVLDSDGSGDADGYSVEWLDPSATGDNAGETLTACTSSSCIWEADNQNDKLTLRAATDPALEGVEVDFAIDNSTVGPISPDKDTTGASGELTTELTAKEEGSVAVYVGADDGGSDRIRITVELPGGADPGPPGNLAYDDENGNGQWDTGLVGIGSETTYTKSELEDGFDDTSVDLVVPSDVGTLDPNGNEIRAGTITMDTDVGSNGVDVRLRADGDIDVSGQSVTTSAGHIDLIAGESGSGELVASNANVDTTKDVTLRSDGDTYIDGATVSAGTNAQATANLGTESATFHVNNAAISDSDDTLAVQPEDVSVSGSPSSGSVSNAG